MKKKFVPCCRLSRTSGVTLLEVVVAIALVSTLLVTSLLALGRHTRQIDAARRKQAAIDFAQTWLQTWHTTQRNAAGPPQEQSGAAGDDMIWRLRQLSAARSPSIGQLQLRVLRLEVHAQGSPPDSPPLTYVDLLVAGDNTS